jgi:hypothetical protein
MARHARTSSFAFRVFEAITITVGRSDLPRQ